LPDADGKELLSILVEGSPGQHEEELLRMALKQRPAERLPSVYD
jgi:hypothetical protein